MPDPDGIEIQQDISGMYNTIIGHVAGDVFVQHGSNTPRLDAYVQRLEARLHHEQHHYVSLPLGTRIPSRFAAYFPSMAQETPTEQFDQIENVITRYTQEQNGIPRLVLLGDPGAGKSTTLRQVGLGLAAEYRKARGGGRFTRLPFWIDLGNSDNPADADELFRYWWGRRVEKSGDPTPYLEDGLLWLLLDGLDQLPDDEHGSRAKRAESLRKFLERYKKCPLLITCRVADYVSEIVDEAGKRQRILELLLPGMRILLLGEETITAFANTYLEAQQATTFQQELHDNKGARTLASNAYALSMMLQMFPAGNGTLPRSRAELFDGFLAFRYHHEQERGALPALEDLRDAWGHFAYDMLLSGYRASVETDWAREHIGPVPLDAGLRLGLLVHPWRDDEDRADTTRINFYHQALYEHYALPLIDLQSGDVEQRVALVSQLGDLSDAARPALPKIAAVYVGEAENDLDIRVYNIALYSLIQVALAKPGGGDGQSKVTDYALAALLEIALRVASRDFDLARSLARARDLCCSLVSMLDHKLDLDHVRALAPDLDLAFGILDLDLDSAYDVARALNIARTLALARARNPNLSGEEVRQRAAELGLNPYDPDKIQAARKQLQQEILRLAQVLAESDSAEIH